MLDEMNRKIAVLADLYLNYRDENQFKEFADYNDIGLPLAHLVQQRLCTMTKEAEIYVDETYDLLISAMGVDPELDYQTIDDMLESMEARDE
jgi:hypothetical protein